MKRVFHCLVAVACCSLVQSALGSIDIQPNPLPVDNDRVRFDGGAFRTGSGGPFLARLAGPAATNTQLANSTNTWFTFCVETDGGSENVSLGTPYRVASTSEYVATATNNTVTNAAKYIYYAYGHDLLSGMLTGYSNTAAMNALVQTAIWSLVVKTDAGADPNDYSNLYTNTSEDYWLNVGNIGNGSAGTIRELRNAAIAAVTGANGAANLALAARIRIINPDNSFPGSTEPFSQAQSMLYEIPEAATIVVWSVLGLIGAAGRRQRD